ncbi:MAG: helix-hairpin-helix domain-containing protein [Chloroflexota bacterium]|nr:helix-hairpin-helix domain-containing protein [Chloroflexota bacterium]MDE2894554.1 helix-hairpin-helix domain-containing protein [Chloroflexota bacterium]
MPAWEMPAWMEIRPPAPALHADAASRSSLLRRASLVWLPPVLAVALVAAALIGLAVQQPTSHADMEVRIGALSTEPRAALIDLNAATLAELSTLPGLGETRAEAIIRLRAEQPFSSLADLVERGILRTSEIPAISELAAVYVAGR